MRPLIVMKDSCEMQFYLNKIINPEDLVDFFSTVLAMNVTTLDNFDGNAPAFLQLTEYETGQFPIGINIAWNQFVMPLVGSDIEVAKKLAQSYQVAVVTDLPDGHPLQDDPFCWCIAEPNGAVSEISENVAAEKSQPEGLLLDDNTKKKLAMSLTYQQAA
jgi:hypothetical protein